MNIVDTITSGQFVNISRKLDENIKDFEGVVSATNHNMMLALAIGGIGMVFINASTKLERAEKIYLTLLGFVAFYSAMHLLNRTSLVLAADAVIMALLAKGFKIKNLIKIAIVILIIVSIFSIVFDKLDWIFEIVSGFSHREENVNADFTSGGGRTDRWIAAFKQILIYPLGADDLIMKGGIHTFAHNTWLDCGVQSGWIAFVIIIVITKYFIKAVLKVSKNKRIPFFQRSYIFVISSVMILQLMVEPVIEGVYLLFLMMFFLWSMCNSMLLKINIKRHEKTRDIDYCA